ncbi:MAG: sodium-dependent transporter [Pseudomonadota bacterium]
MPSRSLDAPGRGHWSGRTAFILAAVGSAVGLGNFWRFPYLAGENGGGAFVLVYLVCVLLVATPLVMAELLIGRRGQASAVASLRRLIDEAGAKGLWVAIGWFGMLAGFLVLSFYSVIAGWILLYLPKAAAGLGAVDAGEAGALFEGMLRDPAAMMTAHALFMILTVVIVGGGIGGGIERAVRVLMPAFFLLLIFLAIFALIIGDAATGLAFLFSPDFSKLSADVFLSALSQAFFSVSLGFAALITYGSYLRRDVEIPQTSLVVTLTDTLVALVAGLAIFPIVFAFGLQPTQGPGLIFVTLPVAFGQMPFGGLIALIFFVLAAIAALTSSISLLEIIVSWLEEKVRWPRIVSAGAVGLACFALGIATVLSFNAWSDVRPLAGTGLLESATLFDLKDFIATKVCLPIGGLMIAVFVAFILPRPITQDELGLGDGAFALWRLLVAGAAIPATIGVLLISVGLI